MNAYNVTVTTPGEGDNDSTYTEHTVVALNFPDLVHTLEDAGIDPNRISYICCRNHDDAEARVYVSDAILNPIPA